jgi:uncharacterized protein (DUF885 family)
MRRALLGTVLALIFLTACSAEPEVPLRDLAAEVAALAEEAWQHNVDQSPYLQVRQGRLIGELPDYTQENARENVAFWRSMLERIDAIPADQLEHEDAMTLAILRWDAQLASDLEPYYWLGFPYSPYQLGFGFNFIHGQLRAHPFTDPEAHPANYLTVVSEYADSLEQLRAHIEGQMERGIYMSKHAVPGVVGMFRAFAASIPEVMEVADERLADLSDEQREAFRGELEALISERVAPAFEAFLALLESDDYQSNAPDAVGLTHYPGGEAYYRQLVKLHTTMEITPEELHELGKERVAELEAEMAAIRDEVGFTGTKAEFHQKLRTDKQFFAESPEEVEAKFNEYIARIEPIVADYFRIQPKAPYGVKRLDPASEATMTFGYYQPPTPDEPVGRYNYNGSKLDERPQIWAGPLIYHELVPGHHFHIALQSENEELPMYRREYLSASAFNEGWGNYGAKIAGEMGLLEDPYDRYGAALFDMFISVRLVVDTGMNLLGWTLDEGRAYMAEHTFQSPTEIATESLRYSTDLFGQALAYKGGLEKLVELRAAMQEKAGDAWDIRDYHDAVLGSGAMPMVVLEEHVNWHFDRLGSQTATADS